MGVNGEALQLRAVYKKPYFLLPVTRQSVSVLQVMRESVSGTTSHARIRIRYYKSHALRLRTRNNTDGNKLVIFSGIALYYGANYILMLIKISEK